MIVSSMILLHKTYGLYKSIYTFVAIYTLTAI